MRASFEMFNNERVIMIEPDMQHGGIDMQALRDDDAVRSMIDAVAVSRRAITTVGDDKSTVICAIHGEFTTYIRPHLECCYRLMPTHRGK